MTHWHDTAAFDRVRDERVAALKATDADEASHICEHGGTECFMRESRSGRAWFLCRACCAENVTLELLQLDSPPNIDGGHA